MQITVLLPQPNFTTTALGKASLLCSRLVTTQNKTRSRAEALPWHQVKLLPVGLAARVEEQGGGRVFCVAAQKASHELLFKPSPHSAEKIRPKTNSKPFSNQQGRRTTHASKQPACKNQMVRQAAALVSSWKAGWEVRHCLALQNFG